MNTGHPLLCELYGVRDANKIKYSIITIVSQREVIKMYIILGVIQSD